MVAAIVILALAARHSQRSLRLKPNELLLRRADPDFVVDLDISPEGAPKQSRRLSFLVSESIPKSKITADALKRLQANPGDSLGIQGFEAKFTPELEPPSSDGSSGVLGADVLDRFALGFDLDELKLSYWPARALDDQGIRSWFANQPAWPTLGSTHRGINAVPISRTKEGLAVAMTIGGEPANMLLTTAAAGTVWWRGPIPSNQSVPLTIPGLKVDRALAWKADLGDVNMPWLVLDLASPEPGHPSLNGSISLSTFPSRRVLLDLPAAKVYFEALPTHAKASLALRPLIGLPVFLQRGRLCLGEWTTASPAPSGADNLQDSEITRLGDLPGIRVAGAAEHPSLASANLLARLYRQRASKAVVEVTTQADQLKYNFEVPPIR